MLRDKVLSSIAHAALHRRPLVFGIWAALTAVAVVLLVTNGLRIDTSRTNMVSEDNADQARYQTFLREFGAALSVVVVIEGDDVTRNRRFADELAATLREDPKVGTVTHRVHAEPFRRWGLLYADDGRIRNIADLARKVGDALGEGRAPVHLDGVSGALAQLNALFARLEEGHTEGLGSLAETGAPAGEGGLGDAFRLLREALSAPDWTELQMVRAIDGGALDVAGADDQGYLAADGGRLVLLFAQPATANDEASTLIPFVHGVEQAAARLAPQGVWVGVAGYPSYIAAEMTIVSRDLMVTTLVALAGVTLLFLLFYGSLAVTVVVYVPLVVGVLLDLGFTALAYGRINMLSSGFLAFLVGLGVDFGVHIVARFDEALRSGRSLTEALAEAIRDAGPAIVTGAATSAAAFLATGITEFTGMQELAVISAAGLLCTLVAALTLAPCLLAMRYERHARKGRPYPLRRDRASGGGIGRVVVRRPVLTLGAAALVTLALVPAIRPMHFSFDVNQFLDPEVPARAAYEKLRRAEAFSPDYAVMVAHSPGEARTLADAASARKDLVARVDSIATYLPANQQEKEPAIRSAKVALARLPRLTLVDPVAPEGAELDRQLSAAIEYMKVDLPLTLRMHGKDSLIPSVAAGAAEGELLLALIRELPPDELEARLSNLEQRLGALLGEMQDFVRSEAVSMGPDDLPSEVRDALFRHTAGGDRYLVRVFPRGSIADPEFMEAFNGHLKGLDPEVTGIPVTFVAFGKLLRDGLEASAIYATVAVLVLLFIDFRTIRGTLLALFPLALGLVWMVGGMNALGIGYNFANVIAIPLILGIGIDSGVHVVHRWLRGTPPADLPATTGKAVLVSSLTTIVGFGALMSSDHRGMWSLGLTLVLGVAACMVAATLVLPALLRLLPRGRAE